MTMILAEPNGSQLVIKQSSKTAQTESEELSLIEQVCKRTKLLKAKRENNQTTFTPDEFRIKLQGEHALELLLKRHDKRICALVLRYQPREGSADADLKQEAILSFIEAIANFDPNKGAQLWTHSYWLIRAKLQALTGKEVRNQIATEKCFCEPEPYETSQVIDIQGSQRLNEAIAQLPNKQQQVIRLVCADTPFADIAEMLGRAIKTIHNLFYAARRQLRTLLGFVEPETSRSLPEKPEVIEPIAVDATAQNCAEQNRVVFGPIHTTNLEPSKSGWPVKVDRLKFAIAQFTRAFLLPRMSRSTISSQCLGFMPSAP